MELLKFQKDFIDHALRPDISIAAMSLPRGNGKSTLAGWLAARIMDPTDSMFKAGSESVLVAASIEQARIVFRVTRGFLGEDGSYRYLDSNTRIAITHKESNTKLRIIGSNGNTAMGLLDTPWAICDEPGAWQINAGSLIWSALTTARGKPDSPLKILIVGTLAPSATGPGHFFYDLIDKGSVGDTHVTALRGNLESWDTWATIRKANPLMSRYADSRKQLLKERDAARLDTRLRAEFLSYRLNIPSRDESEMVLSPEDWAAITAREVPDRDGRPVVGVDLANGRAWASAVAWWPSGRVEALAVAPGIPSVEEQEKRDRVPNGQYQTLIDNGQLTLADGLRVQPPKLLWESIRTTWGKPRVIVCDRFRLAELQDAVGRGARIEDRITRWSDAAFDIRACRKYAKDGPLSIDQQSRALLAVSLSKAMVQNDDQGNCRIVKSGSHNQGRDDVAASLVLAAGATARMPKQSSGIYKGMV